MPLKLAELFDASLLLGMENLVDNEKLAITVPRENTDVIKSPR